MKKIIYCISSILLIFSCSRNHPEPVPVKGPAVRWDMVSVDGFGTKSLVENRSMLERACTPVDQNYVYGSGTSQTTVAGLGQTIGIWADYSIKIDGETHEVANVFDGATLKFNPSTEATDTKWEYVSDPAYWVIGGKYVFRAYYPKNELNINRQLSSAKMLTIEMNTAQTQRDMLVAYNSYDTGTGMYADGSLSGEAGLSHPVKMNFRHAMSAVRFNFKFYDGSDGVLYSSDAITSCWLQVDEGNSFALTGYMIYGDGEDAGKEGIVQWKNQYYPGAGVKFYRWSNSAGVVFSNVDNSGKLEQTVASAYGHEGMEDSDYGQELSKQDGWLVVIPQASTGKLRLYFTTKTGGDAVFTVAVPSVTGTSRSRYDERPDDREYQKDASGKDFVPGWRYTYTVAISKTEADMSLSIAPWKRLDSSYDIKF